MLGILLQHLQKQCLERNKKEDKAKVIGNKILRFYFVGEFDISPFSNMALSILPEVVSRIEGDGKRSATYRLLKGIPDLCNVSDRIF
jgi:hypothetical protein